MFSQLYAVLGAHSRLCGLLADPQPVTDVDALNRQYMDRSEELYDSLMHCHWQPLDSVTSAIPTQAQQS